LLRSCCHRSITRPPLLRQGHRCPAVLMVFSCSRSALTRTELILNIAMLLGHRHHYHQIAPRIWQSLDVCVVGIRCAWLVSMLTANASLPTPVGAATALTTRVILPSGRHGVLESIKRILSCRARGMKVWDEPTMPVQILGLMTTCRSLRPHRLLGLGVSGSYLQLTPLRRVGIATNLTQAR
jgi:hypothetical protein